ncbi:MAG TPA: TonB-dependent receptor [Gemmatimonadaceae bacterium]|nr:TonB-dependent receptor [Gemmatimonadaceae bacterium]
MSATRYRVASAMVAVAVLALGPARARSQRACAELGPELEARASWPTPLDSRVSLRARGISLRDALDRLGALSGVALAYSSDLLPLDRPVCIVAAQQPLGRVLASLLAGTKVEALVVAGRVVLAPVSGARDPETSKVSVLERVIVTGSAIAASRRQLTVGVEVIDGERLRREGQTSLAAVLDASVPGLWLFEQAPGTVVAQYGGIRGASSFSTSYPKMYIDGVEVANPLLVSQIDPDVVDRIEVIRGPQGSALYGSDAISGVINIITRHDGAMSSGSRLQVSSVAGASASAFGPSLIPTHDQRISVRTGTNLRSAGLAAEFGQTGAVFPASQSRQLSIVGDGRVVTADATFTGSARLFDKRAGTGENPLLGTISTGEDRSGPGGGVANVRLGSDVSQRVRLFTLGGSALLAPHGIWTTTLLAGVDGYRLQNVADAASPFPAVVDGASAASLGGAERATLRASSVAQLRGSSLFPASTLTLSLEHSVLRQTSTVTSVSAPQSGQHYSMAVDQLAESWNRNTGALAQLSTSWLDAVFVTGGLRVERNDAFSGADRHPVLPLLGVAVVRSLGGAEIKLRSSYGKGIRPPQTSVRRAWSGQAITFGARDGLDPEVQTGIESGIELYLGKTASFQATRFDQRATGLIQNVATAVDTQIRGGMPERHVRFQPENVGEITNRGWELQGAVHRGALGLSSAFTSVDSRVRAVADGYLGDLRAGDRMLGVPSRTLSVSGSWNAGPWATSLTASRAGSWINYDRIALSKAYAGEGDLPGRDVTGWRLRTFWRSYTGDTHLRLNGSRELGRGLTLLFSGENLLGGQTGEPDNLTIRQGRTLTGGLRASF